jgi:hypothetical protein
MKSLALFVLIVGAFSSFSQKSPVKFGEIPMADLEMKVYPNDSSASAVILSDYGEAHIEVMENTVMFFERHTRIKILKKDGMNWANQKVRLYVSGSKDERISGLKASTYNLENGQLVETKMEKEAVFKEKFNRNRNIVKFTLPNVKEGSVIEYSYKIVSEFYSHFPNWKFQSTIPTRHSEFWATIPDFFIYRQYMQGYLSVNDYTVTERPGKTYGSKAHHWVIKNAPAFIAEPYMTSEEDYLSKMNFALAYVNFPGQVQQEIMGSWESLNKDLLESTTFGKAITGSPSLKKTVDEITVGITDDIQKITAIHNYVKNNLVWDEMRDYEVLSPKKIIEEKTGSSGDINLTLACMLDKAGFAVEGVLLSTRDNGFVRKEYPMSSQFNYVVCLVRLPDNKLVWLDGTNKFLPINVLPEYCLNGEGLVISNKNFGWTSLNTKTKSKTVASVEMTVGEGGELTGKLVYSRDGYDAHSMRSVYSNKGQESYLKEFLGTKTWTVNNSTFENIKEIDKPAKEIHELVISDHASAAGNLIYINPFITQKNELNPFKLDVCTYPVDFGSAQEKTYMMKLIVPDGYVVDEMPPTKVLSLPGNAAKYLYNVIQNGNVINLTRTFQINKNIFIQDEYPSLKEFYNQIVAKEAEQIVLKKQ